MKKILNFLHNRRKVVENFSYLSLLQVVLLLAPLITYPYLVRILGMELYGIVVSAQMLVGYASILVDCGTNAVCAKHVSINRDNPQMLSEIFSSVMIIRSVMALFCFGVYILVVLLIPIYRVYWKLFLITYGMLMQDILFPQYFFQGIEKMKYPTMLSILIKAIFILAIFIVIKSPDDYIYVPLLYMLGYTISSAVAIYFIIGEMRVNFCLPQWNRIKIYLNDSTPLFASNVVSTIKDKFNYFFIGSSIGMTEVTIYDLGIKLNSLLSNPVSILQTVMFPRQAKTRNLASVKRLLILTVSISCTMCILLNIFMPWVVKFFIPDTIDLLPIRILSIAPVILAISSTLATNFLVAFGFNKYLFYSICVTTSVYLICVGYIFVSKSNTNLFSFVYIALISYIAELLYRLFTIQKLIRTAVP